MAESSKTLRQMLLGKIHRAVVTRADVDYVGSVTIDEELVDAAGFLPNEKVDIYNVTNGSRLSTYVIAARRGSGEVGINGAAAHLVRPGDFVIIASYGWMKEKAALRHQPRVVHVDDENRPCEVTQTEGNPPQDPFGHLAARVAGALDQDEQDMGLDVSDPEPGEPEVASPEPLPAPVDAKNKSKAKAKDRDRKKHKKPKTG